MTHIYINGLGNVSPQETKDNSHFLETYLPYEGNRLKSLDPGFRDFIPADMIRRMGRIIKMGVAAAKLCLKDAGQGQADTGFRIPGAIITGTGLGCIEDTEKFLTSMIRNKEELLTPTSFIQSTHNTVAGQIALLLGCHNYNFTYVHRGISFESALTDAIMQIQTGECDDVLAGATDELTNHSFDIMARLGFWKRKPVAAPDLLTDRQRGTIAGEGAAFFFLEKRKTENTYAELAGVSTFLKPASQEEISGKLNEFLASRGLTAGDIDLVIPGLNGDPRYDRVYHEFRKNHFLHTSAAWFKHLCGEYHTATAFATWMAAMIIRKQEVPGIARIGNPPASVSRVLIYNHYRNDNHAFILLNRP